MKNTGAMLLIVLGLFALWAYNTGRAQAVLGVIKDPNYQPQTTASTIGSTAHQLQSGNGSIDSIFSGLTDLAGMAFPGGDLLGSIGGDILGGLGL